MQLRVVTRRIKCFNSPQLVLSCRIDDRITPQSLLNLDPSVK